MVVRPASGVVAFLGIERLELPFLVEVINDVRDEQFEAVVLDPVGD